VTVRYVMESAAERFWAKVDKAGSDECWEWTATRNEHGYGGIRLGGRGGRLWKAHRVAFMLTTERFDLPADVHVCHHCDNPPCCNPAHLYAGDYGTNTRDRLERGRQARGRAHSEAVRASLVGQTGAQHWTHRMPERMNLSGLRKGRS
jgi:hypothetical protein